jgi:hypothetical protein
MNSFQYPAAKRVPIEPMSAAPGREVHQDRRIALKQRAQRGSSPAAILV